MPLKNSVFGVNFPDLVMHHTSHIGQAVLIYNSEQVILVKTRTGGLPYLDKFEIFQCMEVINKLNGLLFEEQSFKEFILNNKEIYQKISDIKYKLAGIWINDKNSSEWKVYVQRFCNTKNHTESFLQKLEIAEKKQEENGHHFDWEQSNSPSLIKIIPIECNFASDYFKFSNNEFYEPIKKEMGWK